MKFALKLVAASAALVAASAAFAQSGQTVKIAMIESFSGPFANVGLSILHQYQYAAEELGGKNNPAGVTFQIVPFDSGGSPQDATTQLKAAIDQGYRYITQGLGSGAALALSQAVTKYNERNPGHEAVFMDYAANDPKLTNQDCSFWHFALAPNVTMEMGVLTSFMKDQPQVKKVYLINQDYSYGQETSKYFQEDIKRERPDMQVLGNVFVPIGQVKDFAPYVAKIKESGADAIVTSNWGTDLTLLVKALAQAGMNLPLYANDVATTGTPTAIAALGDKANVYGLDYGYFPTTGQLSKITEGFKKKYNDDFYVQSIYNGINLLAAAMAKAHSTDAKKVAFAMEGLEIPSFAGDVTMRKSDHQLQQTMILLKWERVSKKNPYSDENTGYTFAPIKQYAPHLSSTPTTCQMKRPSEG